MLTVQTDRCPRCGCPCAVDAWGNPGSAYALRSSCQHGMCGCHQLAEAIAVAAPERTLRRRAG